MRAATVAILESMLNERDPEPLDPEPLTAVHCGATCGDPTCHYSCDPVACLTAAWDAFVEATTYLDDPECPTCGGACRL